MATASRNGGTAKDFSLGVLEGVEGKGRCGLCLELPLYGCDYQGNAVEIFMYVCGMSPSPIICEN